MTPWYLDFTPQTVSSAGRSARVTLPYDDGTPVQNDGRFTASQSDTVFARVMQPGGYVTWTFLPPSF